MIKGLKFRIKKAERLYYLCSENKGADHLRGHREADLRLCFRICKKPVFSRRCSNTIHCNFTMAQISLSICPILSGSSLCSQWVIEDLSFLHADSYTGRMTILWVPDDCVSLSHSLRISDQVRHKPDCTRRSISIRVSLHLHMGV